MGQVSSWVGLGDSWLRTSSPYYTSNSYVLRCFKRERSWGFVEEDGAWPCVISLELEKESVFDLYQIPPLILIDLRDLQKCSRNAGISAHWDPSSKSTCSSRSTVTLVHSKHRQALTLKISTHCSLLGDKLTYLTVLWLGPWDGYFFFSVYFVSGGMCAWHGICESQRTHFEDEFFLYYVGNEIELRIWSLAASAFILWAISMASHWIFFIRFWLIYYRLLRNVYLNICPVFFYAVILFYSYG